MPKPPAIVRAYLESSGSIAELSLLVQFPYQPCLVWQWDIPYLLWNTWGLEITTTWLAEQFRQHDPATFAAVGSRALLAALHHALQLHQCHYGAEWLTQYQP